MASNDGANDDWNDCGVAEFEVSEKRDQDSLAYKVDNPTDATVVAVLHHTPTISSPHIVEANDELSKEGEEDGQHDGCVVEKVEPLVVWSLLKASVEAVLYVIQAECVPSLMNSILFLSLNSPRIPLQKYFQTECFCNDVITEVTLNISSLATKKMSVTSFPPRPAPKMYMYRQSFPPAFQRSAPI